MKNLSIVLKILAVLVAIVGAIYVIVTYGDKIAAGVKTAVEFMRKKFFTKKESDFEDFVDAGLAIDDFED